MKDTDIESLSPVLLETEYPPEVKRGFVRKVYSLLSLQLLFTSMFVYSSMNLEQLGEVVRSPVSLVCSISVSLPIVCCIHTIGNKYPWNLVALFVFTLSESVLVSYVCMMYSNQYITVLVAFATTVLLFISLTAIAYFSSIDFSMMNGLLYISLISLVTMSMFQMFLQLPVLNTIIAWVSVVIFSGYVLHDTSLILKHLGPDSTIEAVISLYLDVINLFINILQLLRGEE